MLQDKETHLSTLPVLRSSVNVTPEHSAGSALEHPACHPSLVGAIAEKDARYRFQLPLYTGCSSMVHSVQFDPARPELLVGEHNRRTHTLFLPSDGRPAACIRTKRYREGYMHTGIEGARFSPGGDLFYVQVARSLYGRSILEIRDSSHLGFFTGQPALSGYFQPQSSVDSAAWSPDGKYIAVAGGVCNSVYLLPVPASPCGKIAPCAKFSFEECTSNVAFHPSGRHIFVTDSPFRMAQCGSVQVMGSGGNSALHVLSLNNVTKEPVLSRVSELKLPFKTQILTVCPDGETVVCAGFTESPRDYCLVLLSFDQKSGKLRHQSPCLRLDACAHCVEFSPDGRLMAVGTESSLTINDMYKRGPDNLPGLLGWYTPTDDKDWVTSAGFSADGKRLAIGVGVRQGRVLVFGN